MSNSGPLYFGAFALFHAAMAYVAFTLVPASPMVAGSLFLVELVTAYDNLIIVLGKSLGIGKLAERLNRIRFFLHAAFIGFLLPVYWGIGARGGVEIFATTTARNAAIGAALAIAAFGILVQYRGVRNIFPVNYYGCLRYAQSVGAGNEWPGYDYSEAERAQKAVPPLASIITVFVGLLLSFWIGLSTDMWVPFVVTLLMLGASALTAKPWGPLATSCLEVIFSAGLLYTLWVLVAGGAHGHGHIH